VTPSSVLVTGSSGFVGSHLCRTLAAAGWRVVAAQRRGGATSPGSAISGVNLSLSGGEENWQSALQSVQCVVHLAARVHQLGSAGKSAEAFRQVNVDGTRFAAEQATRAGVRRFVFLSSIKVNGEGGTRRQYRADDAPSPQDPYAVSKLEAEEMLRDFCGRQGLELVIIRSPLVYGPGVRANFRRLMRLAALGLPLPFGSIDNRRSLINVWNLANFIELCLTQPAAARGTWLISDGEDLSTPELLRRLARLMHRPDRLFAFSPRVLQRAASLLGLGPEMSRLCDSLVIDPSPAFARLDWRPIVGVEEGLARTAEAFAVERKR
jgi:nucleoside-diphosphate-sugar epimerase